MLVTFKTSAYSDITLFGSAAVALLKLMGQSGNVPGAIMADDIPEAVARLQQGLDGIAKSADAQDTESDTRSSGGFGDEDDAPPIGLDKRAGPLISLLNAAAAANENVLWDK